AVAQQLRVETALHPLEHELDELAVEQRADLALDPLGVNGDLGLEGLLPGGNCRRAAQRRCTPQAQPAERCVYQEGHCPDGTRMGWPAGTGVPKSGEPSGCHVNFCIRITRSQPGVGSTLEW